MQIKQPIIIVVLVVTFFLIAPSLFSAQDDELVSLLDKITERIDSYPAYNNLKFMVVIKAFQADEQWRPIENLTTIRSVEKIIDNKANNEIVEFLKTKNGKTRDITQEYIKEMDQMLKDFENKDIDKEIGNNKDIPEGAKKIVLSELEQVKKDMNNAEEKEGDEIDHEYLPFTKKNRAKYKFKKLGESVVDEAPVFIIEAKVIKKDKHLDEGKYYIDKETFDVLRFQGKPSKDTIPFFDVIDKEEQYILLPEGNFVRKSVKERMSADILGRNFGRLINETEYSDYEIISQDNADNSASLVKDSEENELPPDATFND